jgi:hypothetical protein
MKSFILFAALGITLLSASDCSSKKDNTAKKYKARLEIKALCLNYTIKLLEGDIDTSKIVAEWKDESSGKTHQNVFALKDPCTFPQSINEGEEFYFVMDTVQSEGCIVCQAYYPIPPRSLLIKVLDKK